MPPASGIEPLELPEPEPLEPPELEPPLEEPELDDPPELPELAPEPLELDAPASFCPPLPCGERREDEQGSHDDEARAPSARSRASRGDGRRRPMPGEG